MRRKVVLHGPSTLTVSLPTQWVKDYGVKKGDELEVEQHDETLKISLLKIEAPVKRISVDFTGLTRESVESILGILHKSGYDEIEALFDGYGVLKTVQETINAMLIGYEIIEQGNKRCVIKSISSNESEEFYNVLRRIFLVSLSLAKNSLEAVKLRNDDALDEAKVLEETNDRLSNFCHRILNKKSATKEYTHYHYLIIWLLESICDDYRDVLIFVKKNKAKVNDTTLEFYEKVNDLFKMYYDLFYKYSDESMDKLRKSCTKLRAELLDQLNKEEKRDVVVLTYLTTILQRIKEALGSTIGLQY